MRHGLLLVDKEGGCTSHDVVQEVRKRIGQKKIGHCGTLDPDATGLLLLTLGRGTRLTRFLIRAPKVYEGDIRFGQATDTYDASGTVTEEASTDGLTSERVAEAMRMFEGDLDQTPPPYCAAKVGGVKFYELARRGEAVPEKTKSVHVWTFEPTGELSGDSLGFRLGDMAIRGQFAGAFSGRLGVAFAAEIILGGLLPLVLLGRRELRQRKDVLFIASLLAVLGITYNRMNVVLFAMTFRGRMPWSAPESYMPSIVEWGVSIGLIAATIFLFGLAARLMPILSKPQQPVEGH